MIETEQIEELRFEPQGFEPPIVLNPDVFVRRFFPGPRSLAVFGYSGRRRAVPHAKPRQFICIACMLGQHGKCTDNLCPCIHRAAQDEDQPTPAETTCNAAGCQDRVLRHVGKRF